MKKLGKIELAGIPFTVFTGTAEDRPPLEDSYGYCDHNRHEIWLRQGLSPEATEDTLVHEMQHAIWDNSGADQFLKTVLPATIDRDEIQETIIRITTPHLRNALRQLAKLK